jgi:mono/diheme cytochrome c family protein
MTRRSLAAVAAIAIAAVIVFFISTAHGVAGDARAGRAFANRNCADCHAVGRTGASPHARAPTFRAITGKYRLQDLEEGLAEGIVTGHNAMPEFELTPRQIDDLLAHMRRLKRGQ